MPGKVRGVLPGKARGVLSCGARHRAGAAVVHVTIAGAGLIGRLIGWRLRRGGADVTLYERDPPDRPSSAAHTAAGMLAPQAEGPNAHPGIAALAQRSLALWPAWLRELDVSWQMRGSLVVAHGRDRALLGEFEAAARHANGSAVQRVHTADVEPALADRFPVGLLLPNEGWIDNRALLDALAAHCGRIAFGTPFDPAQPRGRAAGDDTDMLLDCRGAGADVPGLRGVRGEVVRVHAPAVALSRPVRLLHPRYRLYVVPRPRRHYVIGATEIESSAGGPVSVRSALELLSAAYSLHPGFAEAGIVELSAALRPAFDDHLPRVQWHNGALSVNGLYRHGFLTGPAIAEQATREVFDKWKSSSTAGAT